MDGVRRKTRDWARLVPRCRRLGFKTWLKEAENQSAQGQTDDLFADSGAKTVQKQPALPESSERSIAARPERLDYQTITTREQLATLTERLAHSSVIGLDTETTSLEPMKAQLVGISIAFGAGRLRKQAGCGQETSCGKEDGDEAFHAGHLRAFSFVASPNFQPVSVLTTATFHCRYRGRCDEMTTDFPVAKSITSTFPASVHICTSTVRTPSTSTGSDAPVM